MLQTKKDICAADKSQRIQVRDDRIRIVDKFCSGIESRRSNNQNGADVLKGIHGENIKNKNKAKFSTLIKK